MMQAGFPKQFLSLIRATNIEIVSLFSKIPSWPIALARQCLLTQRNRRLGRPLTGLKDAHGLGVQKPGQSLAASDRSQQQLHSLDPPHHSGERQRMQGDGGGRVPAVHPLALRGGIVPGDMQKGSDPYAR